MKKAAKQQRNKKESYEKEYYTCDDKKCIIQE